MSTADWYARKFRGSPPPKRDPLPPTPVRVPAAVIPPAPVVHPSRQPVQRQESGCPNCGSANYGSPGGIAGKKVPPRCFDCGEGLAIQNSTQGLPAPGGDTTPAMQVPSAGYNPQQIIGRI